MIMDKRIAEAIRNHDRTGWGGEVPDDDQEAVHDFVIKTLHRSGIDQLDAIKLVHILEGGNWAKGWTTGYDSAKNHYSRKAA